MNSNINITINHGPSCFHNPSKAISTVTGLMIAYDIKEQMTQGYKPNIFKVFAFSCRVVFRLIFFTFGNLTILIFFLNDQRINRWRSILLGDDAVVVGMVKIRKIAF